MQRGSMEGQEDSISPITRQWPWLRYASLSFYSAWILLTMGVNTGIATPPLGAEWLSKNLLYLSSGIPLIITLIGCAAFHESVRNRIERGLLTPLMGGVASVCTLVLLACSEYLPLAWYVVLAVGTGVGTAFVCLRVGTLYSALAGNKIFYTVFFAAALANLLYFMCVAVSRPLGAVLVSLLPLAAATTSSLRGDDAGQIDDDDLIPVNALPKRFFARCVSVVSLFSLAIGVVVGVSPSSGAIVHLADVECDGVFASFALTLALMGCMCLVASKREIDFSAYYYPIMVVACLAALVASLFGPMWPEASLIVVTTSYNMFTLALWCIFTNVAHGTAYNPVYVFGWGRGGSAFGSTLGRAAAVLISLYIPTSQPIQEIIGAVLVIGAIVALLFVLNESTLNEALRKTEQVNEPDDSFCQRSNKLPSWKDACAGVGRHFGLTNRETEVLELLSRGRTTSYIADSLGIAYNTAKGHVRNLYAKCDVHSREEVIDLVERERQSN